MTNFNGDSIIYDEIGNPTQYRDGMAFDWESGRRLASITKGTNSYSYSYDSSGVRISKTVNGTTYSCIYDNGLLIYADTPSGGMTFIYENDSVVGYKYGPEYYYYIKNLQGDIVGVIDKNCNLLYQYEYDAWGNHTVLDAQGNTISPDAPHVANSNPLRYRGYFFDTETGFYLTGSRYYDPVTCRFINADTAAVLTASPDSLYDKNLFAYCDNNPIMRADNTGEFWNIAIGAIIGAVVNTAAKIVTNVTTGQKWSDGIGVAFVSGAASGALASSGVGLIGSIAGNAAISATANVANQVITNKGFDNFDTESLVVDTITGGISGAIGGKGFGSNHLKRTSSQLTKRINSAISSKSKNANAALLATKKAVKNYVKNSSTLISRGVSSGIIKPTVYNSIISAGYLLLRETGQLK